MEKLVFELNKIIFDYIANFGSVNKSSEMSEVKEPALDKKAATPAAKKTAQKSDHPPCSEMVDAAIKALKERGGSSLLAIKKYVAATFKVNIEKLAPFIKKYIKGAVVKGHLLQTKGIGASGSFKLSKVKKEVKTKIAIKPKSDKAKKVITSKPKAAKKSVEIKKPVAKTSAEEKKTVVKKTSENKKPAATKNTTVTKKTVAAKKPVGVKAKTTKPKEVIKSKPVAVVKPKVVKTEVKTKKPAVASVKKPKLK